MTRPASVPAAIELLKRLRNAAPQATADRLEQVEALIQSLSAEAAFLNARVMDDVTLLEAEPAPPAEIAPEPPPAPQPVIMPDRQISDESTAFDMLVGINDALRAPLVAVRGRAELLHAGTIGQISDEQAQWLNAIHENTERAFRFLDSMQQLIAMQRDEVQIDWSDFIATDLLEEAYNRTHQRAAARGHALSLNVPDVVPVAQGDFYRSLVVLTDLLDNAIRYTPQNGEIRLSVDSLGSHVLFSVADNGIGLRPEDMADVGKPFWRGEYHPLVRQHPGTGLSLFLARRVLALQHGDLIFSGESGVGGTFSFTLLSPGDNHP